MITGSYIYFIEDLALSCFGENGLEKILELYEVKITSLLADGDINGLKDLASGQELFPNMQPRDRMLLCIRFRREINAIVLDFDDTKEQEKIYNSFKGLCFKLNITQKDIAKLQGLSQPTINKALIGDTPNKQNQRKQIGAILRARAKEQKISLEGYAFLMWYLENDLSS